MRQTLAIIALLWIGIGCSKKDPPPANSSQPSGLKLNPKPEVRRGPDSPEALARAFQQTLAENNAEAMMMLSLLGYGTNAWVEKVLLDGVMAKANARTPRFDPDLTSSVSGSTSAPSARK